MKSIPVQSPARAEEHYTEHKEAGSETGDWDTHGGWGAAATYQGPWAVPVEKGCWATDG